MKPITLLLFLCLSCVSYADSFNPDPGAYNSGSPSGTITKDQLEAFARVWYRWAHADDLKTLREKAVDMPTFDVTKAKAGLDDVEARADERAKGIVDEWIKDKKNLGTVLPNGYYSMAAVRQYTSMDGTPDERTPEPPGVPKRPYDPTKDCQTTFFLRSSSDLLDTGIDVKNADSTDPSILKTPSATSGATFSYDDNLKLGQEQWIAKGGLTVATKLPSTPGAFDSVWIAPSIDFNHNGGSEVAAAKRLDSLTFGAGAYATVFGGGNNPDAFLFRLRPYQQTDFEFKSLLVGGDFQFEPEISGLGLAHHFLIPANNLRTAFIITPRLALGMDGGHVFDAGQKTAIKAGEDYFRTGPRVTIDFLPGDYWIGEGFSNTILQKTSIRLFYAHEIGFVGQAYNDYGATLNWTIDSSGIFGLGVTAERGGLDPNGDKAKDVLIGLTIKE
jgi:hypothetical protein